MKCCLMLAAVFAVAVLSVNGFPSPSPSAVRNGRLPREASPMDPRGAHRSPVPHAAQGAQGDQADKDLDQQEAFYYYYEPSYWTSAATWPSSYYSYWSRPYYSSYYYRPYSYYSNYYTPYSYSWW